MERQGHDLSGALWSAALLRDRPQAIASAQRAFLDAGADVVTTATYQASHLGFARVGLDSAQVDALLVDSARRAHRVAAEVDRTVWVVGSLGPYGATLHDGSEYTGEYDRTISELRTFHRRRLQVLAEHVDVVLMETIPQLREVEAVAAELDRLGVRSWVSISAGDGALRSGEPVEEAFAIAASARGVEAVGANCIDPADAAWLARTAREISGRPAIIYPNSGESWHADSWHGTGTWGLDQDDADIGAAARDWVSAGAGIVGGCCRVDPAQIGAIHEALQQARQR